MTKKSKSYEPPRGNSVRSGPVESPNSQTLTNQFKDRNRGKPQEHIALGRFVQESDLPFNQEIATRAGQTNVSRGDLLNRKTETLSNRISGARSDGTLYPGQQQNTRPRTIAAPGVLSSGWMGELHPQSFSAYTDAGWNGNFGNSSALPQGPASEPPNNTPSSNSFFATQSDTGTRTRAYRGGAGSFAETTFNTGGDNIGKRKKRISSYMTTLTNLAPDHRYYSNFREEEYTPPVNTKGCLIGQSSMDHTPDAEITSKLATTLFQHDPRAYWSLRDVAEVMPTKINEKEENYEKQIGKYSSKQKEEKKSKKEALKSIGASLTPRSRKNPRKKAKMGSEDDSAMVYKQEGDMRPKALKNWQAIYRGRFPDVAPEDIPSPVPTFRRTVHTMIQAGVPDNGPKDINSCFIKAVERCEDAEFRGLLIEKLRSLTAPHVSHPPDSNPPQNVSVGGDGYGALNLDQTAPQGIKPEMQNIPLISGPWDETNLSPPLGSYQQSASTSYMLPGRSSTPYPTDISVQANDEATPINEHIPMPTEPPLHSQLDYQATVDGTGDSYTTGYQISDFAASELWREDFPSNPTSSMPDEQWTNAALHFTDYQSKTTNFPNFTRP